MAREIRTITMPVNFEARTDDGPDRLVGYAAVFEQEAVIAGFFREKIAAGAFREAIGRDDVRGLFNHDSNLVLGRSTAGTLRLKEDKTGLRYEIDLPDTQFARDLMVSVRRGDISQSSFAFEVESRDDAPFDTSELKDGKLPLRTIKRAKLYDVSPVTFPAYEETSVSARDVEAACEEAKQLIGDGWRSSLSLSRERCRLADAASR